MWESNKVDTKFLYVMKLVNIGFQEPDVLKCQIFSMQALFKFLVFSGVSRMSGTDWKEQASLSSPKQITHCTNSLEHTQHWI